MFSVYRSSVFSITSTASRRVYNSSIRSLKASANAPKAPPTPAIKPKVSNANKVATEKVVADAVKTEASSSWIKENPFVFQLGVATTKTSAADLVAQLVAEGKSFDEVDWKRNFIFVVFGFAYLGAFQYWLMVTKVRTTIKDYFLFASCVALHFIVWERTDQGTVLTNLFPTELLYKPVSSMVSVSSFLCIFIRRFNTLYIVQCTSWWYDYQLPCREYDI